MLTAIVLGYAFLDVPVQVVQGLLYDLAGQTWPTNIHLVDAMLLISEPLYWPQWLLKALTVLIAVAYLVVVWRTFKRRRSPVASHSLPTETSPATS